MGMISIVQSLEDTPSACQYPSLASPKDIAIKMGNIVCKHATPSDAYYPSANMDISRYILVLDTSMLVISNMGRREYKAFIVFVYIP
jgi:hypothetical protein